MTKHEVLMRAIAKQITWIQAAQICGMSDRQMRRLKREFERRGYEAVVDHRGRSARRQRIPLATLLAPRNYYSERPFSLVAALPRRDLLSHQG